MKNKFSNVYLEILNTTLQLLKFNLSRKYSEFGEYSLLSFFLISYTNLLSQNDSSKYHSIFKISLFGPTTKVSPSFIGTPNSCTPRSWPLCVLWHACFIPRLNFLVWVTVIVIHRPESSLYVNRSVKRSSVQKLKLLTACSLFAPANKVSKLFSESSIAVSPLRLCSHGTGSKWFRSKNRAG